MFVCCFVVADLIVKLAKDKFGFAQTEYRKVPVCVNKLLCFHFILRYWNIFFLIGSSKWWWTCYRRDVRTSEKLRSRSPFSLAPKRKRLIASGTTCEFKERFITLVCRRNNFDNQRCFSFHFWTSHSSENLLSDKMKPCGCACTNPFDFSLFFLFVVLFHPRLLFCGFAPSLTLRCLRLLHALFIWSALISSGLPQPENIVLTLQVKSAHWTPQCDPLPRLSTPHGLHNYCQNVVTF